MPKRLQKRTPKRPTDPNQWAHQIVRESTEEREPDAPAPDFASQLSAYMSKLGKKGGRISGKRRMQNLSPEQRTEIASKAARAMWKKRRQQAKAKAG